MNRIILSAQVEKFVKRDMLTHLLEVRVSNDALCRGVSFSKPPFILTLDDSRGDDVEERLLCLAQYKPAYLDIPAKVRAEFFVKMRQEHPEVKLIASFHDYDKTPDDLASIFFKLKALQPDVIKIVSMARSGLDGLRMLTFLKEHASLGPLVAFCMGKQGEFTRVLQPVYGGVWTYSSLSLEQATAPGQIPIDTLREVYHYEALNLASRPFALVGAPLDLSLGYITHNKIFRIFKKDAIYVNIPLVQEEWQEALLYLQQLGFGGLSVTMPLKNCRDSFVPLNTVCFKSGMWINTDGVGALDALEEQVSVVGKKILIFGAGATTESIACEALNRGAQVFIYNRTAKRAVALARKLSCDIDSSGCGVGYDIVINATSVDFALENCESGVVGLDVRNCETTLFLESIKRAGGSVVSGRKMWVRQAAKQLALWLLC